MEQIKLIYTGGKPCGMNFITACKYKGEKVTYVVLSLQCNKMEKEEGSKKNIKHNA